MQKISGMLKIYSCTPGQRNEIDEIISPVLLAQSLFGQQILDPNWGWLRHAHIHILYISIVVYVIFGTIEVLEGAVDTTMKMEGFYTFVVIAVFLLKFILFAVNRNELQQAYLVTKTELFDFIKQISAEKSSKLLKNIRMMVPLLLAMILIPVSLYVLSAIFSTYVLGKRVTLSKSTSILMSMTSPYYEIGFLLHTIFLLHMTFTILVIDMWYVYLMFFYCSSDDCLKEILCVSRTDDDTDDSYATKLNLALRKFYFAHEQQMRYFNILVKMYKWQTVVPLCHVLISTCSLLFTLSVEFNWAFLSFASNLFPTLTELYTYNWFGEKVKSKAIHLSMALQDFDWPSMRVKDKKNFYIIVTYMQKEFGIKTAFGNYMSLLTMSSVLKGSYQAFAVLKTMEN